jgi:AcrR family transcriptional regulator
MSRVKPEQAEVTRRALVRVARRLFARRGFDAVSSEEIVAAASVTRGALYHHFDGKEGLFRAVLTDVMGEVHGQLAEAARDARTPREAVERGIASFLDACARPSYRRILLVDGPAVLGWHEWRALDLTYGLGLLRRGLEAMAVPDAETATHVLAGALVDGAMLVGQAPEDGSVRRRVQATLLRILDGLATGAPGS